VYFFLFPKKALNYVTEILFKFFFSIGFVKLNGQFFICCIHFWAVSSILCILFVIFFLNQRSDRAPKEPVGTEEAAAAEPGAAEAAAAKAARPSTTAATSSASAVRQSAAVPTAKISTTGSYINKYSRLEVRKNKSP
jgi:hypothetical protein